MSNVVGQQQAHCSHVEKTFISDKHIPIVIKLVTDWVLLALVLFLAGPLGYFYSHLPNFHVELLATTLSPPNITMKIGASALVVATLFMTGIHKRRNFSIARKCLAIFIAVTAAYLVVYVLATWIPSFLEESRPLLVSVWLLSVASIVGLRVMSSLWRQVFNLEERAEYVRYHGREESDSVEAGAKFSGSGSYSSVVLRSERSVLVIGGAGYIGSALLPMLLKAGKRVRLLDVMIYGTEPIANILGHPNLQIVRGDFRKVEHLIGAVHGVSDVVHLGGIVGDPACVLDEDLTIDVNVSATRSVAEVARGAGVRRFIFASSCSVYGANDTTVDEHSALHPVSLYARTKLASEQVLLAMINHNFQPLILRFATIFGVSGRMRFDLVVNLLTAKAILDKRITVCNGEQWRPFVHVDDVARSLFAFLEQTEVPSSDFPVFNIGASESNFTINQVAKHIEALVPGSEIVLSRSDEDRRDYRVCFDKLANLGFSIKWTLDEGIQQVMDTVRRQRIINYYDAKYSNELFFKLNAGRALARPDHDWARKMTAASVHLDAGMLIAAAQRGEHALLSS
jgi:nucleoside-diphosphate-sugar epimerase